MKLSWAKHFLSEILCQKDIKIESLGAVEQRLKHRKVLIVLDDVDEIELLETLVGQIGWFGFGSRIIVVTQDRQILESHEIELIYEVEFPSEDLALQMFCRSAFRRNSPPDGFIELAVEVAELAGNLPLGLDVLGSSLRNKDKEEWGEMMPMLRNGLNGKIEKTLRACYEGLDEKDYQDVFVYIACLFNGESVNYIKNLLETSVRTSVNTSLRTLADKSLLRIITPHETVEMHILLQKLGREIVRAESINNPGKRRFLVDAKDISDVFNDNTGTENVLGLHIDTSEIYKPLSIDEKSFEGMRNLQFIKFYNEGWSTGEVRLYLPRGFLYLPRKLRLLHWDEYPAKCLPSSFSAEYLVELIMEDSKLEKLWEGAQPCRSLKVINLSRSPDLKEFPDLSNATSLDSLILTDCTSLVALPSSIRNLNKLRDLCMERCTKLEVLPTDVNLESLDYLDLRGCSRLRRFPRISRNISRLELDGTAMDEEDCLWIENLSGLIELHWTNCPLRCMPSNFHPEHLVQLQMRGSKLEKLWDGVKSLPNLTVMYLKSSDNLKEIPDLSKATSLSWLILSGCKSLKEMPDLSNAIRLRNMNLSGCKSLEKITGLSKATNLADLNLSECENLKEIPNLSKATNLEILILDNCTSLVKLPSSFQHHEKLRTLNMSGCTSLKILPTNINLVSLPYLNLSGCSRLTSYPQLSTSIEELDLSNTAIEEVPSWIENIVGLTKLSMSGCTNLEDLPTNINLVSLTTLNLSGCSRLTSFPQLSTSIKELSLNKTAIEEVPSWIENIAGLTNLWMTGCKKLRKVSATIWNLDHLEYVDFTDCGVVTVSDASLVKTVAELHEEMNNSCSDSDTELQLFHYFNSDTRFLFHNCFNLDQDAHKFILQSNFRSAILPGKKVPTYFTHRTRGSCLTVPLPQSSLSQNHWGFTACMIIDVNECPKNIIVHSKFRGVTRMCNTYPKISSSSMDHHHLLMFHFWVNAPPSQLDCNSVKFEFELHKDLQNCPIFPSKVIECGVRVLDVSSSLNGNDRSSETEYAHQSGESDVDTERSKKRMRMKVVTSQEPSNSLCGHSAVSLGSMAPNLELSLGLVGSSPHVSSRSKVPSPSTSSWNFHGDGPPLNLSLSPFDQCLEEECDPMITEQLDTEIEDTLSFPQLTNYFR